MLVLACMRTVDLEMAHRKREYLRRVRAPFFTSYEQRNLEGKHVELQSRPCTVMWALDCRCPPCNLLRKPPLQ